MTEVPAGAAEVLTALYEGDVSIIAILADIRDKPESVDRYESLALVHTFLARRAWQDAARLADLQQRVATGKQVQGLCPGCGQVKHLNRDGHLRAHGRPVRCDGSYELPTNFNPEGTSS
jgi:predicted RNA-binding Zn-ribbon protein involved in translation (DUF1610 family)